MGGTCIYMYVRVYCTPVPYPPVHTIGCKMGDNGKGKKHNELSYHFYICIVRTVSYTVGHVLRRHKFLTFKSNSSLLAANHSFFSKT